jgi:hypothetical protein
MPSTRWHTDLSRLSDPVTLIAVVAAGRLGLGAVALLRPRLAAAAWLGRAAGGGTAATVLGRALGGRDLALAAGALLALRSGSAADIRRWAAASALADSGDAVATLTQWRSLPAASRLGVLVASAGAAVVGAVAVAGLDHRPSTTDRQRAGGTA